jgi:hypothetical protein
LFFSTELLNFHITDTTAHLEGNKNNFLKIPLWFEVVFLQHTSFSYENKVSSFALFSDFSPNFEFKPQ